MSNKKDSNVVDNKSKRHKRRIRNVILSYIVAIVVCVGIGAGIFFGIRAVGQVINDKKTQLAKEQAALEAELLAKQESEEAAEAERIAELQAEEEAELETEIETETEEIPEVDVLDEVVGSCISEMTLEEKVAGLFIITPEALTKNDKVIKAGDGTKAALEKYPVGGIIYSSSNVKSADQLKEMIDNTVSFSRFPLFICSDDGLGDANKIRKALKLDSVDDAATLGEGGDANITYEAYKGIGEYLASYGFNLDFGTVADITVEDVNYPLKKETFGSDAGSVTTMVTASVQGLNESGVSACIKHFPGQGAADADPSKGLATSDRALDDYVLNDITVFTAGIEAGADMVMVGNFIAPALTGDEATPCSLSKAVMTDLLRGEYQYNGVIITDAFNVPSIKDYYGSGEAAVKALKSGADMILMPEKFEEAYQAVVDAVNEGTISEQRINDSLARVYRIKYRSTVE